MTRRKPTKRGGRTGYLRVEINKEFAAPSRIAEQYPAQGWTAVAEKTAGGIRIKISGDATDRLLMLE